VSWRTRTALLRAVRVAPPLAERAREEADRAGRLAVPGEGSGVRQIGQFWTNLLWRQKLGGTTLQSRPVRRAATPATSPRSG